MSCNVVSASVVTGVAGVMGVTGVRNTSADEQAPATSASLGMTSAAGGFGISLSTLSGLKGNKPVAAHPARMFLFVIALSLAGLYR
jgi:hypothetical protein